MLLLLLLLHDTSRVRRHILMRHADCRNRKRILRHVWRHCRVEQLTVGRQKVVFPRWRQRRAQQRILPTQNCHRAEVDGRRCDVFAARCRPPQFRHLNIRTFFRVPFLNFSNVFFVFNFDVWRLAHESHDVGDGESQLLGVWRWGRSGIGFSFVWTIFLVRLLTVFLVSLETSDFEEVALIGNLHFSDTEKNYLNYLRRL